MVATKGNENDHFHDAVIQGSVRGVKGVTILPAVRTAVLDADITKHACMNTTSTLNIKSQ